MQHSLGIIYDKAKVLQSTSYCFVQKYDMFSKHFKQFNALN